MPNYGSFLEDMAQWLGVIPAVADRKYQQESARKAHPPAWDAFPMLLFSNRWLMYSDDKKETRAWIEPTKLRYSRNHATLSIIYIKNALG